MRGDPARTEALIDTSRHVWTYRAGVISFAAEDAPSEAQQAEVMDRFEALVFAGLEAGQSDILWVRHSHEGRVELHFCTPRFELTSGNSLNIAPPGYQTAFDSLRDLMNKAHDWADPMDPARAAQVQPVVETESRARNRDDLRKWLLAEIEIGQVTDRESMLAALTGTGFAVPGAGKDYLTVLDPESGERWRLKGDVFRSDWVAEKAAQQSRDEPTPPRRLDAVHLDALRERFDAHCAKRAGYNRERYPNFAADMDISIDTAIAPRPEAISDRDRNAWAEERDRVEAGGAAEAVTSVRHSGLSDQASAMRDRTPALRDQGSDFSEVISEKGEMHAEPVERAGARIAWIRRAVGEGLRGFGEDLARLGGAFEQSDRTEAGWLGRLRGAADRLAARVHDGVAQLAARGRALRQAGDGLERKLGESESRRRTAEAALRGRDWGREF
ncbi:mobilization relaxase [Rhodobacter maris]|uniref:mobilization relaxase n=1 Tax=Rhodobacter maris TaxID=446682 RepID=UPI0011427F8C|nr:mobilization relaxase [Rhodobacter maris]